MLRVVKSIVSIRLLASLLLVFPAFSFAVGEPGKVTLNLSDAKITAVIGTVAKITGRNFIIDPRVKGKVTVVSSTPMDKDEVYQVFLSILDVHGFSVVPSGDNLFKVLPDATAKQSSVPIASEAHPGFGDELVTRVVQVNHVTASQLVPILRPLVPQQGHMAAYPASNILILSDRASNIKRLEKLIARIDQPTSNEVEVVSLEHASSSEVVRILTTLMQQSRGQGGGQQGDHPVIIADERTNSILITGGKSKRLKVRALISHLDTPLETGGNTHVVYLRYTNAKDLVPVLTGVSTSEQQEKAGAAGQASPSSKTPISIQADENTNALVITAPPDLFRSLKTVIKQLDVRRAQVLVEAIIAEVSLEKSAEFGIQWLFDGSPSNNPVGGINVSGALIGAASGSVSSATSALGNGISLGFGDFNSDTFNFASVIRALEGDGETNILSTPSVLTLDNVEAEIKVGKTVPFVGQITQSSDTNANPFQSVERKDVGITLKVTPQINEGDAVKLEISQEVSSLAASAVGAVDLITNTRSINTTVMVEDGNMVVLGGLISEDNNDNVQRVPILGSLPLIGSLFRYSKRDRAKSNLMVFIRPVILRDESMTERVSHGKYSYMRAEQISQSARGHRLMSDVPLPLLPSFDELKDLPPPVADDTQQETP